MSALNHRGPHQRFLAPLILVSTLFAAALPVVGDTYDYDELGRLKAVTFPDGTRVEYALDSAGNRRTLTTNAVVPGQLQWTTSSAAGSEGGSPVALNVSRTGGSSGAVLVSYNVGGTATQGTDYTLSGTLSWANGDSASKSITVTITDDPGYDPNETVVLTLTTPTGGASLGAIPAITLTIADNDTPDTTPPTVPGTLNATSSGSPSVNLSWVASTDSGGSGLASYRIERCQGAGCSNFAEIASTGAATTTYIDSATSPTTPYVYRVRARDQAGNNSGYSNTASVTTGAVPDTTPPTDPTGLSATAANPTTINLLWTGSTDSGGSGLASYRVERCTGSGCSDFAEIGSTTSTSYADTSLTDATTYGYRVRARDGVGNNSGYSNIASATTPDGTPPAAPTSLSSSSSSSSSASLNWMASSDNVGVTSYRVERCTGSGCSNFVEIGSVVGAPPATAFVDSTTSGSTLYVYRIKARDAAGNDSGYSNSSAVTTPDTFPPSDPANLSANVISATRIDLAWTASTDTGGSGLASYRVERCSGSGCSNYAEIGSTASTSYSDTTVVDVTTYQYRVRARDGSGNNSGYSNVATATTPDGTPPTAPTLLRLASTPTSTLVSLAWDRSTDNVAMATYRVERCTGSGCSSFAEIGWVIGDLINPVYHDNTAAGTTTYVYRVKARDSSGLDSAYSNNLTVATPDTIAPTVPMNLATNSPNSNLVNLAWTASTDNGGSGLAGYNVYRNTSIIGTATSASYADTTVVGSTQYTYNVQAFDNAGNLSPLSAPQTVTTGDTLPPPTPTDLSASAVSPSRIDLTFTGYPDVGGSTLAGFRIYRGGALVQDTLYGPYFESGLSPSTNYCYTVRAYDSVGNVSGDSNVACATTQPPGTPSPPTISPTFLQVTTGASPTVSWTNPSGTTSFNLYRSANGNPFQLIYSGTNTSFQHVSAANGEYLWKVNACNASGCSIDSNLAEIWVCPVSGCQ